jgi:hypothetical protein
MTITPPPNVSYGRVVWQALSDVTDGPDSGTRPDFIAPSGEVTFVASTVVERNPSASPNPVSILRDPIAGVLDDEGYLCTPGEDGLPAYRGVDLIATDDPDLNPTDWVYNVSYKVKGKNGRQIALASHQIYVPTDAVVDLTTVGPVDNATAIGIPQAEALAAQAAAAAEDASVAASQALAAAEAAEAALTDLDTTTADNIQAVGSQTQTALSAQRVQALATNTSVTWSGGLPATETLTTPLGNLVKTFQWDAAGNPVSCAWDMPAPLGDLVETFTYDSAGNPTGSTFAGA